MPSYHSPLRGYLAGGCDRSWANPLLRRVWREDRGEGEGEGEDEGVDSVEGVEVADGRLQGEIGVGRGTNCRRRRGGREEEAGQHELWLSARELGWTGGRAAEYGGGRVCSRMVAEIIGSRVRGCACVRMFLLLQRGGRARTRRQRNRLQEKGGSQQGNG